MEFFYLLLVLLMASRIFGELAEQLGQPALVGELLCGIVLGASAAHIEGWVPGLEQLNHDEVFTSITDLGMFFLMLYAGIEMQPSKILRYSGGALAVAVGGMVLPLALGIGLGFIFLPEDSRQLPLALFIGTSLAITAVPATVKILMDLQRLDTRPGQIIVAAALFDDVLSLVLLAWLTGMIAGDGPLGWGEIGFLLTKILGFFAITALIGWVVFPWGGKFLGYLREKEAEFSLVLIGAFAFAILAEWLGLHFILGAFMAGMFFGRSTISEGAYEEVRSKVSAIAFGFLAPIFFASIGLHLDLSALTNIPLFLLLLVLAAFGGKVLGAGLMARVSGLSHQESLAVGVGMSARGAVELVIADIALRAGLFENPSSPVVENLFSAVVIMAVLTTVATPLLLKLIYRN